MTANNETAERDINDYIGEELGDKCPRCGAIVWTDKTDTKWCENPKCNWSNNPEFEIELNKFWKKAKE